jgi:hypothetical protein
LVGRNGTEGSVYLVRAGRSFRQQIVLGQETEGQAAEKLEVTTGVAAGDHVVDEPSPVLQDGGDVHAIE